MTPKTRGTRGSCRWPPKKGPVDPLFQPFTDDLCWRFGDRLDLSSFLGRQQFLRATRLGHIGHTGIERPIASG